MWTSGPRTGGRLGDIVIFQRPDHIVILSCRRNKDDLPYLLHNDAPPRTSEGDDFRRRHECGVTSRFRYPY